MIRTLQFYVTRELLKTFTLTAVGLTLTFSLCGGVLNMIQAEVLTAVQVLRMLAFVLPIALTLTLPVSALFACAIVYGRMSADNEIDACRASGVNIHRLLLPAVGLSIATAAFTYTFTNHLIPRFIRQVDAMVQSDIQKIIFQALSTRGYVKYRDLVLYAGQTELFDEDPEVKTIRITRAAFLELEHGSLTRCGTAREAQVDFRRGAAGGTPIIEAALFNVRWLDVRRNEMFETDKQRIEPTQLPNRTVLKPKWLTLPDLLKYQKAPLTLPTIQDSLQRVQWLSQEARFYKHVHDQLTGPAGVLRLTDDRVDYEIRAEQVIQDPEDLRPTLRQVTVSEKQDGRQRSYSAGTCRLELVHAPFEEVAVWVHLVLRDKVVMTDAVDPGLRVEHDKRDLERVGLPAHWPEITDPIDTKTLLGDLHDPAAATSELPSLNLGTRFDKARETQRREILKLRQEITGIIHSRLAFSASTVVILILAAALGIIFRGGQLLTAFVISFIPGMLVVVANIMGRQLADHAGTHVMGLAIIWLGIVIVALADFVVLTRYLKR